MKVQHRRGGLMVFALAFALIVSAIAASSASAAAHVYCVNFPVGTCSDQVATTLQNAFTSATANPGSTIQVYSGTYTDANLSTGSAAVNIVGVGPYQPIFQAPASGTNMTVANGSVSNVEFVLSGTNAVGLSVGGGDEVSYVTVTGTTPVSGDGILVTGQATNVHNITVNLPHGSADNTVGVYGTAASSLRIADSSITATQPIQLENLSNGVGIERVHTTGSEGILFTDSNGTISSSLIVCSGYTPSGYLVGIRTNNTTGDPIVLNSFNNTVVQGLVPAVGFMTSRGIHGGSSTINVNSNVVVGFQPAFAYDTGDSGLGSVAINVDYSRYTAGSQGNGTINPSTSKALSTDGGFTNPGAGDYSLSRSSELVDAGDPNALGGSPIPSAYDLAGNTREVNGVGGGGAVRDIGAYELQNRAPTAKIVVGTASPTTVTPIAFSGSGSTEPDGDSLSYHWTFDDGGTASGVNVQHVFTTTGIHTAQLTTSDSTGLTATASVTLTLATGSLALKLSKATATVDKKGAFSYSIDCPTTAVGSCSGKLLFQTATKVAAKRFDGVKIAATKKKILKAAQYVFTVKAGTTKKVKINTYKSFQTVLKKQGKVALVVSMSGGSSSNAKLTALVTKVTLKKAKKK